MNSRVKSAGVMLGGLLGAWGVCSGGAVVVETFDIRADWSDASNPNGRWSYLEGVNPLPFVASWQSVLGGWGVAQPGWARSENGNNRLPFWFRSNGSELGTPDWIAGDVVVHSTDPGNGVGNGIAAVEWRAPARGVVSISGGVWLGRDIGRGNAWRLFVNGVGLRSGVVFSGDAYSRANPFLFANGSGTLPMTGLPIACGGVIRLEIERTTTAGDWVGVSLSGTFTPVPCAGDLNGDGSVNTADLTTFLGQFGQTGAGLCADLNNDGSVNTSDLVTFLGRFGGGCV